jgi:SOS-response transcriptional repressor LexA
MKQHEALCLAINCPVGDAAKFVLLALVAKLDWETWAKPMSVSYIEKALRTKSRSTISRGLAELQTKGIIERHDIEGRADGVRLIKLNTSALTALCQSDIPPMSKRHTPSVSVTYPLCQPDIPPMSEGHTPYVTVTDNIISNNQISNLNDNQSSNQSEQTKSLNSARETWGSREAMKDNSSYWGTSSGRGLTPATQPRRQKTHQEKMAEARELMKRTYAK